jgi:hypothetical protein
MRRIVIAVAAAGIVVSAAACSAGREHHGGYARAPCRTAAGTGGILPGHLNARGRCAASSPPRGGRPGAQPSGGGGGVTGTWAIVSCQVDVTYIDVANTVDYYVPDTGANFRQHYADNKTSGDAGLAVVITLVNDTGGPASLPTGLVVSFTDQGGSHVGSPRAFNNANGTGYGAAVANGRGSGEVFSSGTRFNAGQAVAESPDIGASVPHKPDLNCQVSQP